MKSTGELAGQKNAAGVDARGIVPADLSFSLSLLFAFPQSWLRLRSSFAGQNSIVFLTQVLLCLLN